MEKELDKQNYHNRILSLLNENNKQDIKIYARIMGELDYESARRILIRNKQNNYNLMISSLDENNKQDIELYARIMGGLDYKYAREKLTTDKQNLTLNYYSQVISSLDETKTNDIELYARIMGGLDYESAREKLTTDKQNLTSNNKSHIRERIPSDVQNFVWKRDGGRCVVCGSNEKLEFDHIIPVSKGGSNTPRNIQLLCEKHNRHKGGNIGTDS